MTQFITPVEAARLVGDDMTLAVSGHAGFGTPDGLFKALHDRYGEEGHPRNVTLVKIAGTGDGGQRGGDRLAAVAGPGNLDHRDDHYQPFRHGKEVGR